MISEFNTPDDIFKCKKCGDCCTGFGGTYITDKDVKRISEYIQINADIFISKFCDVSGTRHVLTQRENGKCIFFDMEKKCTIHPVKPYMCRAWPFLAVVVQHPENWNAMADSCPGMKKDVPTEALKKIVSKEISMLTK